MFKPLLDGDQKPLSYGFYLRLSIYIFLAFGAGMYVSLDQQVGLATPEVTQAAVLPTSQFIIQDILFYKTVNWATNQGQVAFTDQAPPRQGDEIQYFVKIQNAGKTPGNPFTYMKFDGRAYSEGALPPGSPLVQPGATIEKYLVGNRPTAGTYTIEVRVGSGSWFRKQLVVVALTPPVLKVEALSDKPSQSQFASGSQNLEWMRYKLSAVGETIEVKNIPIKIAVNGAETTTTNPDIVRLKAYTSTSLTGTRTEVSPSSGIVFNANGALELNGLIDARGVTQPVLTVSPGHDAYLFLKVDLNTDSLLRSGDRISVGIASATYRPENGSLGVSNWGANGATSTVGNSYRITANSKDSGQVISPSTINSTGNATTGTIAASYDMYVFDTVLSISRCAQSQPCGEKTSVSGTQAEVMRLKFTASGTANSSDAIGVRDLEFVKSGSCTRAGSVGAALYRDASDDTSTSKLLARWSTADSSMAVTDFHVNQTVSGTRDAGAISGNTAVAATTVVDEGASTFGSRKAFLVINNGSTRYLRLNVDVSGCTNTSSVQYKVAGSTATTSGIQWFDRSVLASGAAGISGTPLFVDQTITVGSNLTGRNYTAF